MADKDLTLTAVLSKIRQADDLEINEIIQAVIGRYEAVFPDWEVMFLSLPKNDPAERSRSIEAIYALLKQHSG